MHRTYCLVRNFNHVYDATAQLESKQRVYYSKIINVNKNLSIFFLSLNDPACCSAADGLSIFSCFFEGDSCHFPKKIKIQQSRRKEKKFEAF